jgi:beta-lactamase regulating signal transducer with metallopeptidase domain
MIQHLDQYEVEAVLAHELEHVVRRDYLFTWITLVLRDAFFYLPTSRRIYRQIQIEKELMCDQQAVQRTHRPLALASALTKVWLHAVESLETPQLHMAQPLTGRHAEIQARVERLLSLSSASKAEAGLVEHKGPKEAAMLGTSFCLQGITMLLVMILMGCIPLFLLNKLF